MTRRSPIAVIILAAGSIKNKYKSFSFIYNSPALVPIASRSTISFILDFYEKRDVNIYIAINREDEDLFRKELLYYKNVVLLPIDSSRGVCDTLSQTINTVPEEDIIVNLATTIPTKYASEDTIFIDDNLFNHNYYSGIVLKEGVASFKTKTDTGDQPFYAFTGVFRFRKQHLSAALNKLNDSTDLLEVVKELSFVRPLHFETTDWIDTGHEINYADARRKLISSRSFNAITVDNYTGILTKKSSNVEKLLQEIKYVNMLPSELQIQYPRILPCDTSTGSVLMEYYGYPNLSEYQLYRSIEPLWWTRIFEGLGYSLQAMGRYRFSIGPKAFEQFYFHKTIRRVDDYLSGLPKDDIFITSETLVINGYSCANISSLKNDIAGRTKSLYREADFCVMHGDFCFNNILFDTVSNTIKLIDPRGSFGEQCIGIYGDKKYDLAKLLHSTIGHYDYIVNNLFQVEQAGNEVSYSFPLRDNQAIIEALSYELLQKMNADKKDILFIVGLLFLSMCPLHTDNPQRQRLMYAHGLYFVNKNI